MTNSPVARAEKPRKRSFSDSRLLGRKKEENAFSFLVGLANPAANTSENEWRDFKTAGWIGSRPDSDKEVRRIWSENLGAFANSGGGVVVWGIKADNKIATAISLANDAPTLAARLEEVANDAVDPPIMGVAVRAILKSKGEREGFVVCYVPESQFTPHRSVWANQASFYIRFQDGNQPCPTATLRRMFYPHSSAFVVPLLKVKLFEIQSGRVALEAGISVANKGTASAHQCYIELSADFGGPIRCSHAREYWEQPDMNKRAYQCRVAIHPGLTLPFLRNICPDQPFEDWPERTTFTFGFSIFAEHAAALCASENFEVAELKEAERRGITREATMRPLGWHSNVE